LARCPLRGRAKAKPKGATLKAKSCLDLQATMIKLTLNLPIRHRLTVQLQKRRGDFALVEEPLLPSLKEIKNTRSGNKISRYFRHVFEHKNIKKILGSNLALAILATSVIPASVSATTQSLPATEETVIHTSQPLTTQVGTQYPVREIKINQGYSVFHPGVDFDGEIGDEVRAIKSGRIEAVQFSKILYGNAVIVDHGEGLTSLYAHLSKIVVAKGQEVSTYTKIGEVGSTGRSTGSHLHLETHLNGYPINPFSVLPR